jgi:hypothetical protein
VYIYMHFCGEYSIKSTHNAAYIFKVILTFYGSVATVYLRDSRSGLDFTA